jgi:hypothetical protein
VSGNKNGKKMEASSETTDMELEVQTDSFFTKIRNTLSELEGGFDDVDRLLEPLLSQSLSELASSLGPIDRARLYLLYGYTLNSLISCQLIILILSSKYKSKYSNRVYIFVVFLELKGQDSKKILEEQYVSIKYQRAESFVYTNFLRS